MRFLVPLDVRGCADQVVGRALWLARSSGAHLDLLTVAPPPVAPAVDVLTVDDAIYALPCSIDAETATLLAGFVRIVRRSGLLGDVLTADGGVAQAIVALAKSRRPELIIMGSHGRTGVRRAVFGSVAEEVVRHVSCGVLIEPAGHGLAERPSSSALDAEAERNG